MKKLLHLIPLAIAGLTLSSCVSFNTVDNIADDETPVLKSIRVNSNNAQTTFNVGEQFTSEGIVVTATFTTSLSSTTRNVTSDAVVTAPDMSSAGTKSVGVSYTSGDVTKTTSYNITVNEGGSTQDPVLSSISVSGTYQTTFTVNDTFTHDGAVVTAHYTNGGADKNVTSSATFSTPSMTSAGNKTVNISYTEGGVTKNTSYSITVNSSTPDPVDHDNLESPEEFTLLTTNSLEVGSYLVFGNGTSGSIKVLGDQKNNNRGVIDTTVTNNKVSNLQETAGVFYVEEGTASGTYSFWDIRNKGYLSAKGGTNNNYLKLEGSKTGNSSFSFTYNSTGSTLVAQGSNDTDYRGTLYYNKSTSTNLVYSCYKSNPTPAQHYVKPFLYVSDGESIWPESIEIQGQATVGIGEDVQYTVSFNPSNTNKKTVTWESSVTSVATVSSSGLVHGVGEGDTVITARALKEDNTYATDTFNVHVEAVAVTGVTLNSNTETIYMNGSSLTLTANVAPSNATNKNVSWSSNATSVAQVTQSGVVSAVSTGTAIITATTQDGSFTASCTVTVSEEQVDAWTILLYLCGSDLESDYVGVSGKDTNDFYSWCAATADLNEIKSVNGKPNDVNFLIQTGGASKWSSYSGVTATINQRWELNSSHGLTKKADLTDLNMGEYSTLQSFIAWGLENYPAEKTGVILWDHGGAMTGVCVDRRHSDDCLTAAEVKTAVSGALSSTGNTGKKLEFIGYDACLMGVADIASVNSDYFNYMVASQETEPGYGWDYTGWLDDLYAKKSTTAILDAIATSYKAFYEGNNEYNQVIDTKTTQAVYDLSQMSSFISAFNTWSSNLTSSSFSSLNTAFNNSIQFGYSEDASGYLYGVADAKDFITRAGGTGSQAVLTAINNLVISNKPGSGYTGTIPCGICVFMANEPTCGYYPFTVKAEYTTNDTKLTTWRTFNINNGCWYQ